MPGFGGIDHVMIAAYVCQTQISVFKFNEVININLIFYCISKLIYDEIVTIYLFYKQVRILLYIHVFRLDEKPSGILEKIIVDL